MELSGGDSFSPSDSSSSLNSSYRDLERSRCYGIDLLWRRIRLVPSGEPSGYSYVLSGPLEDVASLDLSLVVYPSRNCLIDKPEP